MGCDAYSLLAYGCELSEDDITALKERLACKDIYHMFEKHLEAFNTANDCKLEHRYSGYDCLIYVDKPSHFSGSSISNIDTIGSGPTLTMTIDDKHLAAIEAFKREWPETAKEWGWKVMTTYD